MKKNLNMAILGLGAIAGHMANAMNLHENIHPCACACRNDAARAETFAGKYGFAKAYGSYLELVQDPEIDLIYIAVPHALHYECAMLCMKAGKNVLVEKPFAANAAQAEEMISYAKDHHLFCGEGLWSRYLPVAQKIQDLAASDQIGEIGLITGEIGIHLTQERLFDPAMAGGALLDVGVYACSYADLVFAGKVSSVTAAAGLTDRGVDETTGFILRYENGASAVMNVSMKYMNRRRGTICGTAGYAEIDDVNCLRSLKIYDQSSRLLAEYSNPDRGNGYLFELDSVVQSMAEGRIDTPECPHDQILRRMRILDQIRKEIGESYPFESAL